MKRVLVLAVVTVAACAVLPGLAAAAEGTLKVVAVGHGSVVFSPAPTSIVESDPDCAPPTQRATGQRTELITCTLTYEAGTQVSLTASGGEADGDGGATTFGRWSDDRCPAASTCTVTVGAEPQTVAALFSPQRVSVWLAGTGAVTSSPAGAAGGLQPAPCVSDVNLDPIACSDDFPLDTLVTLGASSAQTTNWLPQAVGAALPLCDARGPSSCQLRADRPRWGSIGFGGAEPVNDQIPPEVSVAFSVRKAGAGSGTVRGQSLECGGRCTVDRTFGDSETLVATPDPGSRFDRWRAACGTEPTCRLAVGPVTAVTAVFERAASPSSSPSTSTPAGSKPSLAARVTKVRVRGHGRRRAVLLRVEVNTPATVRARLLRGRRQVTSRSWRLDRGSHLLRMRVPARARAGAYSLAVTVSAAGQTKRTTRSVRLRR